MKSLFVGETKRNFILDRLKELNISKTQTGKDVHECGYEELKYEYTIASFREIDIKADENKWF